MKQLLMEQSGPLTELALLSDRELTDYRAYPEESLIPEQIYLAQVDRVAKGMAAAFVRLPDGQTGFLPFSEARSPMRGGQRVLVQVKKPPVSEKAAYLTEDISLPGRFSILLPYSKRRAVSSRVTDENIKASLLRTAEALAPEGMGLILRRVSAGAEKKALEDEVQSLLALWEKLKNKAYAAPCPSLIWAGRSCLARALDDWESPNQLILPRPPERDPGIPWTVADNPFALWNVRPQRQKLLARRVWLKSGGFLVVDPCEALTAIDVNTGKNTGHGRAGQEALFLSTNLEAVRLIARLLRVRGIGGIILIDLIDMAEESSREQVLNLLRQLTLDDPVKCVVHGFTSLGLIEMTRKKTDIAVPAPADFVPCPACGGSGVLQKRQEGSP